MFVTGLYCLGIDRSRDLVKLQKLLVEKHSCCRCWIIARMLREEVNVLCMCVCVLFCGLLFFFFFLKRYCWGNLNCNMCLGEEERESKLWIAQGVASTLQCSQPAGFNQAGVGFEVSIRSESFSFSLLIDTQMSAGVALHPSQALSSTLLPL